MGIDSWQHPIGNHDHTDLKKNNGTNKMQQKSSVMYCVASMTYDRTLKTVGKIIAWSSSDRP